MTRETVGGSDDQPNDAGPPDDEDDRPDHDSERHDGDPESLAAKNDASADESGEPPDESTRGTTNGQSTRQDVEIDSPPGKLDDDQHHSSRRTREEPHVSLTIEGEYESVFERVEHPQAFQHSELDRIMDNIEATHLAVVGTGGGIRSEIYEAVDFELDDPWEIRKYLEVLEMHDLIRLQDDHWIPSDYFQQTDDDPE